MKKISLYVSSLIVLVILGVVVLTGSTLVTKAQTPGIANLNGWAWSSNTGWLSFSSTNPELNAQNSTPYPGGSYAVTLSTSTGALGGYAWSPSIGWVSFNSGDMTGCPRGTCAPTVNLTTGAVTGWARTLKGSSWIELSGDKHASVTGLTGSNTSNQGVSYNTTTGVLSGFAFGSDGIGWLNFTTASPVTVVGCQPNCGTPGPIVTLQVIDLNGIANNATVINYSPSSGQATANVQWSSQSVTAVSADQTSDWPSTSNGTPSSFTPNQSGSAILTFTGLSATQSTQKTLRLNYTSSNGNGQSQPVTITLTPNTVTNNCVTPNNALACGVTTGATGPYQLVNTCSVAPPTVSCSFVCDTAHGYTKIGNICSKSSEQEL
jgi:hypothetical protein